MTFIGKLMLLLHTIGSFAILTWSVLHYTNRMNWADVIYEGDRGLDASVKYWQQQIADQHKAHAPRLDRQAQAEADWEYRRIRIAEREAEARAGKFYNIYFNAGEIPPLADKRDDATEFAFTRSNRLIFGPLPDNRLITGVEKQPLQSVEVLQKSLDDSSKEAANLSEQIATVVSAKLKFNQETQILDEKTQRLKKILRDADDELDVLIDSRINWDEQLETLTKRHRQLLQRLGRTPPEPKP